MTRSGRFFCLLLGIVLVGGLLFFWYTRGGISRLGIFSDKWKSSPKKISLVSWNCQNLFDAQEQGSEYSDYRPVAEGAAEKGDWRESLYRQRLARAAEVLRAGPEGGGGQAPGGLGSDSGGVGGQTLAGWGSDPNGAADVICLQEVEGLTVARDLAALLPRGYPVVIAETAPDSAIQTAVLSRLPLISARHHRLVLSDTVPGGGSPQRYIQEIHLDRGAKAVGPRRLVVFNNHWKSRRGGVSETAVYRRAAEKLLQYRVEALENELEPGTWLWVAAGDFNQPTEEFHLLGSPQFPALSGWTGSSHPGTYFFRNQWARLDHLWYGSGAVGSGACRVLFRPADQGPWADEEGRPRPWRLYREEGWSDHLPLRICFDWSSGPVAGPVD